LASHGRFAHLGRAEGPGGSSGRTGALLYGDPYDFNSLNAPNSIADYFRAHY